MYESYYGFNTRPFQSVPNPDIFYLSEKHQNALTCLKYGILERSGFILLTGEVGCGKTALIKYILNTIESDIDTAVIFNTNVSPEELLCLILNEFELDPVYAGKTQALDIFYTFLIEKYAQGKQVVLIIDEAQNLSRDALEEVRMLSNLQSKDHMLLQVILVGQPELRQRVRYPDLMQLNQRITMAYHIDALESEETKDYIAYRIEKAGGNPNLFKPEAIDLIHKAGKGIPRNINILCDMALVYGCIDEVSTIDIPIIEQVIQERLKMGLSDEIPEQTMPANSYNNERSTNHRFENLESGLNKLNNNVELKMMELEKTIGGYKEDLVRQMDILNTNMRRETKELPREYSSVPEMDTLLTKELDSKRKTGRDLKKKRRTGEVIKKDTIGTYNEKDTGPKHDNSNRKEENAALIKLLSDSGSDF